MENYVFKENFLEENNKPQTQNSDESETKPSISECFFKLVFVNTVLCTLLVITALILNLCAPKTCQNIKSGYLEATRKSDITAADFKWAFDKLYGFLFTPQSHATDILSSDSGYIDPSQKASGSISQNEPKETSANEMNGAGGDTQTPSNASLLSYVLTSKISAVTKGSVTSPYGSRIHPIFKTSSFHSGIDIANKLDTPVCSAFGGKVLEVGKSNAYGNYIIMRHSNNLTTFYGHLNSVKVSQNMNIRRGEIIGYMGSTGYSTGPHLHFEIRINGSCVDPQIALKGIEGIEF